MAVFWCAIPTRMEIDDPHDHKHIVFNILTCYDYKEKRTSTLLFTRTNSNWSGTVRQAINDILSQLHDVHRHFVTIRQCVDPFSAALALLSLAVKYWRSSLTEIFYLVNAGVCSFIFGSSDLRHLHYVLCLTTIQEQTAHRDLNSLNVGEVHDIVRFLTGYSYDIAVIVTTIRAYEIQRQIFSDVQKYRQDPVCCLSGQQGPDTREEISDALRNIIGAFDDIEASCNSLQKRTQSLLDLVRFRLSLPLLMLT
jgi:hypothetical protein